MKIRSPILIRLAARLMASGFKLLFKTVDLEVLLEQPRISPYADTGGERFIYCIWHDSMLGPIFGGPQAEVAALTSQHTDGTIVADVLICAGITPIRGSSSRGGARAVKQMMAAARNHHIVIATDGPRGPRQEVKEGVVYLAAQTGRRIVPVTFDGSNCWRPKGKWTDLIIPKPFSKAYMLAGKPIHIPERLTKDDRAKWTRIVQETMQELNAKVQLLAAGESIKFGSEASERLAA